MNKEFENGRNDEELENAPQEERGGIQGESREDAAQTQEVETEAGEIQEEAPQETEAGDPSEEPGETEALLDQIVAEEKKPKEKKEKKKRTKADSRRFRYGSMATAVTILVVALVVVLNVIVSVLNDRFPLNLDLTKNKLFSLSDNSVSIAKGIGKEVQVTVFYPEDGFKNPSQGTAQLNDMLKEFYVAMQQYTTLTGGKVSVEYVDLNLNPALATKYQKYNPSQLDILFVCGDRYRKITMNDLYQYNQASDYYSEGTYTSLVERTIASQMKYLTAEQAQIVTVFTGHEEDSNLVEGLKSIYELNGYEFKEFSLASSEEIDPNTVAALIPAPSKDYTGDEIARLQKWLENDGKLGRNLMVFTQATAACPNLYEFLNVEYGLEVTDNLIMETSASRTTAYNPFYTWADLESTDYTQNAAGERTVLAWQSRQILTHKDNNTENSLYNVDIMTFPDSARLIKLADATDEKASAEEDKSFAADEYPIIGLAAAVKRSYDNDTQESIQNHVIVSGSALMGYSQVLEQFTSRNEDGLLGILNAMTGVKDDINVSSKSLEKETVEFSDTAGLVVGLGVFTFGVPAVTLIICLVVFLKRRHL